MLGGIDITIEALEELGSNFRKDIGILISWIGSIIKKIFGLIIYCLWENIGGMCEFIGRLKKSSKSSNRPSTGKLI